MLLSALCILFLATSSLAVETTRGLPDCPLIFDKNLHRCYDKTLPNTGTCTLKDNQTRCKCQDGLSCVRSKGEKYGQQICYDRCKLTSKKDEYTDGIEQDKKKK